MSSFRKFENLVREMRRESEIQAQEYLWEACREGGHPAAVHKLLENYAKDLSLSERDPSSGMSPLNLAIASGCVDTVRSLLSAGSPIQCRIDKLPKKIISAFESHALNALASNDIKMFSSLLNAGLNPDTKDGACLKSTFSLTLALSLIFHRTPKQTNTYVYIYIGTSEDNTLLHWAASFGRYEILKQLLGKGADKNVLNSIGRSVLDEAERGGHDRCAALLRPSSTNIKTTRTIKIAPTKTSSKQEQKKNDDTFKTLSWTCKNVDVPAGDVFELPISAVVAGSKRTVLTWNFTSYGGDVGFGVIHQEDDSDIVLLRRTGVPSGVQISGSVEVPPTCRTLLILFDNTFSWWNDKQVSYKFELRKAVTASSRRNSNRKKEDTVAACREVMKLTREAIQNASEATKSLRLNRERAERHLRDLEEKVKQARRNLFRCVAAVNAAEDTVEKLNSRMRSLVLKHVMSYDSIRSSNRVRQYLESSDILSFRCTSSEWYRFLA